MILSGILCGEPTNELFPRAIEDLMRISENSENRESGGTDIASQTDALNCLKEVITNKKLKEYVEPYISKLLGLAASCMDSKMFVTIDFILQKNIILCTTFG